MDDLKPGTTLYDDMMLTEEKMGSILPFEIIVSIKESNSEDIDDIKNDFEIGFRAARKPRLVSNQWNSK